MAIIRSLKDNRTQKNDRIESFLKNEMKQKIQKITKKNYRASRNRLKTIMLLQEQNNQEGQKNEDKDKDNNTVENQENKIPSCLDISSESHFFDDPAIISKKDFVSKSTNADLFF